MLGGTGSGKTLLLVNLLCCSDRFPHWFYFSIIRLFSLHFDPYHTSMDPLWWLMQRVRDETTKELRFQCKPELTENKVTEVTNRPGAVDGKRAFIGVDDFTDKLTTEYKWLNSMMATQSHSNTAFGVLTQGFKQPAVSVSMQDNTKSIIAFGGCNANTIDRQVYTKLSAVLAANVPQPAAWGRFFQNVVDGNPHHFLYIAKDNQPSEEGLKRMFFKNFEQDCDPKNSSMRAAVPGGPRHIRHEVELAEYLVGMGRLTEEEGKEFLHRVKSKSLRQQKEPAKVGGAAATEGAGAAGGAGAGAGAGAGNDAGAGGGEQVSRI
jgi:hypothetical protein